MTKWMCVAMAASAVVAVNAEATETVLVPAGSTWKYLDDGSDQGAAWQAPGFADGGWASGPAQLGYGDGDEATVVSFGGNSSDKHVTTYFRHEFAAGDLSGFTGAVIRILRDDGAVVYLNGTEVVRTNMPAGAIDFETFAPGTIDGAAEDVFNAFSIDESLLAPFSTNVLAVEIHQRSAGSSDISFDFELAVVDDTVLIPAGATWKYLDDGTNQMTAWRDPGFDDATWASGPAQLGYGDGDEATVVSFGPNAGDKYITTYFRHTFTAGSLAGITGGVVRVLRDDGAVVFLNGTEIFRTNMPPDPYDYLTWAPNVISGAAEDVFNEQIFDAGLLNPMGSNVVAVEVHQRDGTSSDLGFDLELVVFDDPPLILRGPYLQQNTDDGITIKWRTNVAVESVVNYGSAPGNLSQQAVDTATTTEHCLALTGLDPDTVYFYGIEVVGMTLAGDDADHFFRTAPPVGTRQATRIWVIGDSGTADANALAVYNAYRNVTPPGDTDLWLMLGDNAYSNGTDGEYQAAVFDHYPELLRQVPLWPTLGNHDGHSADSATESGPYYEIFDLPRAGEVGGWASGTEAYYSFDYANIHFICLESYETDRSPGGAMMTWLANDLGDTLADWVIAFWHHPPYTKGSHDSDTEIELVDMRQNALPILDAGGVDLVLCGHSHSYERSYLLDGHYGISDELITSPELILNPGDGRPAGNGAYHKPTVGPAANEGAVYVVAGSSGKTSGGTLDHEAMLININQLGSVILEIDGDRRLDAQFLQSSGAVTDTFTILKGNGLDCDADTDGNGQVDIDDIVNVVLDFGSDGSMHNGDVNNDGVADIDDIVAVVLAFGPCPGVTNDLCIGAGNLPATGNTMLGSTAAATPDSVPDCGGGPPLANSQWYRTTGDGTTFTAGLCGSFYDTRLTVFCGGCADLQCFGGNDPIDTCGNNESVSWCTEPGVEYLIMVHGEADSGGFSLTLSSGGACGSPVCQGP